MKKKYIKNWIKKAVLHNLGWKLLSLFFAMFLWFIVMNIINPTEVKTYSVGITMLNKDKLEANEFVILNEEELNQKKIEIKLRGTRAALDELNKKENRDNIKAVVDLSQFELLYAQDVDEVVKVGVTPSIPSSLYSYTYQIVSYTPSVVDIKLDNVSRKSIAVNVDVVGNVAPGYISSTPKVDTEEVVIIGAESELEKVSSANVYLDITGATSNIEKNLSPVILDNDGVKMENLKIETETVNVKVSVNKQGQLVIVKPETSGEPAEGYFIEKVDFEPKFVEVIGDEAGISNLSAIELPPVNVDDISEDKNVVFDIRPYLKDTGLYLKNESDNEIYVTVKLGKDASRIIDVPSSKINIKGLGNGLTASVEKGIELNIGGDEDAVNSFDLNSLNAEIDLNGLGVGNHTVEVSIAEMEGIKIDAKYYVNININKGNEDTTQETTTELQTIEDTTEIDTAETEVQNTDE